MHATRIPCRLSRNFTHLLLDESMNQPVADRLGHDRRYAVDRSTIAGELGYAPQVSFVEGLAATVAFYRDRRDWWEPLKNATAPT